MPGVVLHVFSPHGSGKQTSLSVEWSIPGVQRVEEVKLLNAKVIESNQGVMEPSLPIKNPATGCLKSENPNPGHPGQISTDLPSCNGEQDEVSGTVTAS